MNKNKSFDSGLLKENILEIFKARGVGLNSKQIAGSLELKGGKYRKKITAAINELCEANIIIKTEKYKFKYKPPKNTISGIIDINSSGHGYMASELYQNDIFIHRKNRLTSLNKDTICIELIKNNNKIKPEGRVTEILSRANEKFIGVISKEKTNSFFIPDNSKVGSDFFIPNDKLGDAHNQDRVIVQFIDWPKKAGCPFGKVIKVLRGNTDLKSEIETNIEIFNIRNSFSTELQGEVQKLNSKIGSADLVGRKDLRKEITFTIDPEDAKDFDDAISIKFISDTKIKLGVHIADVGHYVKTGSNIDQEAFLRAFSVYFPGKVVPMLPERLSNLLCSLRPNEDKLCFSILIEIINFQKIGSVWMGKTIINSKKRFTYEGAQNLINAPKGMFNKELRALNKIAQNLRKKRIENGSIDFERTDVVFELNKIKEPMRVLEKRSLDTHKLVEEFMLLANRLVANELSDLKLSVYRVHDLPDIEKLKELSVYLKHFNCKKINTTLPRKTLSATINNLLKGVSGEINKDVMERLILRTMAKAKYSTKNIGHYGLGFEKYTHFTSPIRRYADLITHRLLDKHLNRQKFNLLELEKKCIHFSNIERVYVDVERKVNKFIQLKLLENSVGKPFRGVISSVVKWGAYVEIEGGQGEGLVSFNDLDDDKYYYNDKLHCFVGRNGGKKYTLGQGVLVEIKTINLIKKEMDLLFI